MKVLIVAFDGLDYKFIRRFNCESLMQKEFGKINLEDIYKIATPEIFSNFLTGKNWKEHGVKGFFNIKFPFLRKIKNFLLRHYEFPLVPEIYDSLHDFFMKYLKPFFGTYERTDLKGKTFLDEIEGSEVIALSPPLSWLLSSKEKKEKKDKPRGIEEILNHLEETTDKTKEMLFNKMQAGKKVLMAHFHEPDNIQHIYLQEKENRQKIKEIYRKMDRLTQEIKKKASEEDYEVVLFFSDHGVPTEFSHKKRAFYSLNRELNLDNPKMRDFYKIIVNLAEERRFEEVDE